MAATSPPQQVLTVVSARVPSDREADLRDGYRAMTAAEMPDGLTRSELLRGPDGTWRIESLWRDLDALQSLRAGGQRPAALELLERVGTEHSHGFYFVEDAYSI